MVGHPPTGVGVPATVLGLMDMLWRGDGAVVRVTAGCTGATSARVIEGALAGASAMIATASAISTPRRFRHLPREPCAWRPVRSSVYIRCPFAVRLTQ